MFRRAPVTWLQYSIRAKRNFFSEANQVCELVANYRTRLIAADTCCGHRKRFDVSLSHQPKFEGFSVDVQKRSFTNLIFSIHKLHTFRTTKMHGKFSTGKRSVVVSRFSPCTVRMYHMPYIVSYMLLRKNSILSMPTISSNAQIQLTIV